MGQTDKGEEEVEREELTLFYFNGVVSQEKLHVTKNQSVIQTQDWRERSQDCAHPLFMRDYDLPSPL